MSVKKVQILEQGQVVDACVREDLTPDDLVDVEAYWGPARIDAIRKYRLKHGLYPEHWRWNWAAKAQYLSSLAYSCFGIEYEGQVQGLMMIETVLHRTRLAPDKGKPLVYIEYIETAPWNVKLLGPPRFQGVGVRLFEYAVRLSIAEGFYGRVGLHALPQAESFYRETCNMVYTDQNPDDDLPYYELSRERARLFLPDERKEK